MTSPTPPAPLNENLPKQQLGDTPVAPWEMPTPAEKAKAEPVRQALQQAVENVDTPEKADEVAEKLERAAGGRTANDVAQTAKAAQTAQGGADRVAQSAQAVQHQADQPAAPAEQATDVITKTVEQVAGAQGRDQEVLSQAVQEVLNPEQQGAVPSPEQDRRRRYLREAVIKRMAPVDALDARLYLAINHLPHNRWSNSFFYFISFIFKGGLAWYGLIGVLALFSRKRGGSLAHHVAVPLTLASLTVEFPVKTYVRRRRPFLTVLKATVVGKKPGSWSFPSGHSAGAFGGAYLLSRRFPRWGWAFYTMAALVGFSRIYLGDHYPGDVLSGALAGMALAKGAADLQDQIDKAQTKARRLL